MRVTTLQGRWKKSERLPIGIIDLASSKWIGFVNSSLFTVSISPHKYFRSFENSHECYVSNCQCLLCFTAWCTLVCCQPRRAACISNEIDAVHTDGQQVRRPFSHQDRFAKLKLSLTNGPVELNFSSSV